MFALLPAIDVYPPQVERLFGQTLASMGSVHGEHDLLIDQPVLAGTAVSTRVAVTGVHVKASGTAVVVQIESRGEHGTLLNTQYAVQFLRGFDAGASAGARAARLAGPQRGPRTSSRPPASRSRSTRTRPAGTRKPRATTATTRWTTTPPAGPASPGRSCTAPAPWRWPAGP